MRSDFFSEEEHFDDLLKCVRLKWATRDGGPYIDLVPLFCLRGKV